MCTAREVSTDRPTNIMRLMVTTCDGLNLTQIDIITYALHARSYKMITTRVPETSLGHITWTDNRHFHQVNFQVQIALFEVIFHKIQTCRYTITSNFIR